MTLRRSAGYSLLAVLLGSVLASSASAQYPPTTGNGQVSSARVEPGDCVTFSGDGFAPGADVTVTDNGSTVGTVKATATGTFSTQVCPTVLGVHLLRATDGTRVVTAEVTVVASLSATGASNVPRTVGAGGALVLIGAGFVYVARRRRAVRFS